MNNNVKIQSLWIGEKLSKLEQLSIQSFLDYGHEYVLYTYNIIKDMPEGAVLKDANKVIPKKQIFKYKDYDSYAGFADLFRYKLLLEKGGFWVDTDIVCVKPFKFKTDYLVASENIKIDNKNAVKVTNCVLKAPPNSKIMDYCYHTASKGNPQELSWGETGPDLVHQAFIKYKMIDYIAHPDVFCPINWWEWNQYYQSDIEYQLEEKLRDESSVSSLYAYHFWNEMWRRNNVDKNGNFAKNSIYEKLKKKHGIF